MKKLGIIFLGLCMSNMSVAQENNAWHFGLQWGFQGNNSLFSGGDETANARFEHNSYGAGAFDFLLRYDVNKHWMVMGGLGFSAIGFEYSLYNNYSLLLQDELERTSVIRDNFSTISLPTMVFYKFNPNCKNWKWIAGAGFAFTMVDKSSSNSNFIEDSEGNSNSNYLTSESISNGGAYAQLRFSFGREKLFKKGNMLNFSIVGNIGFEQLGTSTVNYEVDGQNYMHQFSNNGNFVGFRMAYFFRSCNFSKIN